jgi:large repetitive protein
MISNKQLIISIIGTWLAWSGCADNSNGIAPFSAAEVGAPVQYHYDAIGRLVQAVSPDGASVHYQYDAVGNITAVRRLAVTTLSVIDFAPRMGTAGATVAIYGSGFDPALIANAVSFNGTPATVLAAAETSLTVAVPAAATSGKLTVSNVRGSATSVADFVLKVDSQAPTIVSFTPTVGTGGTQVRLVGTRFQLNADDDKVTVGGQPAVVVSDDAGPSATQLTFVVPSATASGRISITTPFGKATTRSEFFAIPAAINPADVAITERLVVNGAPLTLAATGSNKKAVLLFDAEAGQRPRLVTQGGTPTSPITADVYAPNGTKLTSLPLARDAVRDFSAALADSGTYTLVLSQSSGSINVQLSVVVDAEGELTMDGNTPITLLPGQNGHFTFTAEAGKGYGIAFTGLTFAPATGANMGVTLKRTDGTGLVVLSAMSIDGSQDLDPLNFATSGTYLLELDPAGVNATGFNVVLSKDAGGPIMALDTAVPITRAGQNARFMFTAGTLPQTVHLELAGTLDDGDPNTLNNTALLVFKPSDPRSPIASGTLHQNDEKFGLKLKLDVPLPEAGEYTIFVNPTGLISGTLKLKKD